MQLIDSSPQRIRANQQNIAIVVVALFALSTTASALPVTNVALNKQVTLEGTFFNNAGSWGGTYPTQPAISSAQQALADTVTDGIFKPDEWQWNNGTTWWDTHNRPAAYVNIDLAGTFYLESFVVQADDNDAYLLEYWNLTSFSWATAWNVPNFGNHGWGLQTRPNDTNNSERYMLGTPITTTKLRLSGVGGDQYYSTSEIQAFGYKTQDVPEPATLLLLGAGLMAGGLVRRKRV
ncbi:hypothetical protein MNBD_NITROSPINAE01-1633 [hydrothermal vent metagenome]|uniref:Ice-binding protein C-terminal domain-containing protein n=1 Tax=hydrothermal vent metagenome TaxID=652676 RepID=A0A3B1BKD0_9ZZZZ